MIDPVQAVGWLAALLTFATYAMKTMLPLRLLAIATNLASLTFNVLLQIWPSIFLHAVLLPFNVWRLWQILALRRKVRDARRAETTDFSLLKQYSRPESLDAGAVIFQKGDAPDRLYYIAAGEVRLEELGLALGAGDVLGELAFFTDAKARSATARCETPCTIHSVDEATFMRLYFQDPSFGMAMMKLISRRLIDGMDRAPDVYRTIGSVSSVRPAGRIDTAG